MRKKIMEKLIAEKDKLSSIVFRRKSQSKERFCVQRKLVLFNDIDRELESVVKCEATVVFFLIPRPSCQRQSSGGTKP